MYTCMQTRIHTHRQTNSHEYPVVSLLEKFIVVVVSFIENWAIHSHILNSKVLHYLKSLQESP